ncbi:MAG: hypothetical protein CSB49_01855, partial [Proteobacteria bacterium]
TAPKATKAKAGASLKRDPKAKPENKTPAVKTPAVKKPAAKTPAATTTAVKPTGGVKPAEKKPAEKKPAVKKPAAKPGASPASKPGVTIKPGVKKAEPPKKVLKKTYFKGNKATNELMTSLAKLRALRSLGKLGKDKLDEFGLTKSTSTLTLKSGSTTRTFIIGDRTYGNTDYYLQDKADQRVYVVRARPLSDMRYAEFRLMDRDLTPFPPTDVEKVVLVGKGKSRTLYQLNRRTQSKAFWADEKDAKRGKELHRSWIGKLKRLRALEYTRPGQAPKGLRPLLEVRYFGRGKRLGTVTLLAEQTLVPGTVAAVPKGAQTYYAKSDNTRVPVKLSKTLAAELAKDIDKVMN